MHLDPLFADMSKLEIAIGLPPGFIQSLIDEDDWSFVVKSHAIVEAAISHLLSMQFDPRLAELIHKMSLSGGRVSKIAIIKKLDLLDQPSIAVIERIAQIRNDLVHDVKLVSFCIEDYFRSLDSNERAQFAAKLSRMASETNASDLSPFLENLLLKYPKKVITAAILYVLGKTLFRIDPLEEPKAREKSGAGTFFLGLALFFDALSDLASKESPQWDQPSTGVL